ncbi:MAG TPA: DUF2066 domain-containing protein [Stellaceae bacterium]|nr:DUF2066 domain-containing protein [Stellaceae bacterium]
MFDRWLCTAGCVALILALALSVPSAAAEDDSFTVANVHEDVTAASALVAKDQAQADGQQKAYDELMNRLAPGKSPHVSTEQLTDLVAGFEVANEHTSTVRYVADYTFHFNPTAIRRLLQEPALAYAPPPPAAQPAQPIIVLPVYIDSDRAVLWDDPNPWRDAWAAHVGTPGALSVTVPAGDLPDVSAIDAPKAIAGDAGALKAISARYQNEEVLVVQAKMHETPRRLDTTVTRYAPDGPGAPQAMTVMTSAKPGETDAALMNRAVFNVIAQVGQAGKSPNVPDTNAGGMLDAVVQSGSLGDWVAVRNRLRAVASVRSADLVSFDRNQIRVAIRYSGDQNQLRAALRQRNLDLTGSDPDWTLVIQTAAPPPAPPKPDSQEIQPGALRKADGQP